MKPWELMKGKTYTDGNNNFRLIIAFYDDLNGNRMVQYEKGFVGQGKWRRTFVKSCGKQCFASWAVKGYVFKEERAS